MEIGNQPGIVGVLELIETEFAPSAVIVLHKSGQILHCRGTMKESEFPAFGALVAAMASAGKSISKLDLLKDEKDSELNQFYCESQFSTLYAVSLGAEHWLAVFGDHPRNPGLFRMKIRRSGKLVERLGLASSAEWTKEIQEEANLPLNHETKSSLFENITDDEIENLFTDAKS